jgi:hypothetical protein
MDADRRRRVLRTMLDQIQAVPADIAGPAPLDPVELVQAISIEAEVLGDFVHDAELGTRVAGVLDRDLIDQGGGWRRVTRAERRGDSAASALALFRESRSW